ncbi:MAG: biotin--[Firmicutes bacterium]|nr:biotin--[acetyl-CoA-carboxylase] ligase [Bacillota bacterium]
MSTKLKLLEIFSLHENEFISGQKLADMLGITRNSIWKAIKKLQDQGYEIESKPSLGYRLIQKSDVLSGEYIQEKVPFPCKIHILDCVDSTNDYAKTLTDLSVPNIVIANEQTKGKGRLGRSFYSPASKGIYMTIAFEPDFGLDKAMLVTTISALAVCQAFEATVGLGPKIKWVNDIYLNGKKVCGILTEAESNFETGKISKIILGIGINCFEQSFPDELAQKATYIEKAQKEYTRNDLIASVAEKFFDLLSNFDKRRLLRDYKSRSLILGEPILIFGTSYDALPENGGRGVKARAIDIDENGGLVVEYSEGRRAREMDTITSGEVTIRKDLY